MSNSISFSRIDSSQNILSPPLMDSQDSSVAPPQPLHHLLHQQLLESQHLQQQPNSYDSAAAAAAFHHHQQFQLHHQDQDQQQFQQQQQSRVTFSSMVNSATPQLMPSMDYTDGGNVTSPPTGGGGGGGVGSGSGIEAVKRKRGRPRKNSSDGSASGIAIGGGASANQTVAVTESGGGAGAGDPLSSEQPVKKHRGRPPGSGKKQLDALGIAGLGLTPHVIKVSPGEDIATKIMAFTQQGPRTVCVLTANGAVCNVTLRQPATSCSNFTYEGIFEILSLSGSFLTTENNGTITRTGGLSVALAKPDGSILGGGVAGTLKAASAVQIIVASFVLDEKKQKPIAAVAPPPNMLSFVNAAATDASPPSQGGGVSSNSSDENGSPLDQGAYANAGQHIQNLPMYSNMACWGNTNMNMHPN